MKQKQRLATWAKNWLLSFEHWLRITTLRSKNPKPSTREVTIAPNPNLVFIMPHPIPLFIVPHEEPPDRDEENWENQIELYGEVIELSYRGSLGFYSLVAIAERKRREKLSQWFIALFALIPVSKESSYSSDDSDKEEEKPSKTPQKSAKDVEMVDADSAKKVFKTPSTPSVATGGSKTLFVGNLSFSLQRSDFEEFFKDCGEVVDVRFSVDDTGRFKRF
ncbi:hypothetical protein Ahy_A03g011291 [Arachis hypogaea]|uniref:RRM domain-containing protein n=1 Tax=Arachis hypogaea TaxID=3818 RepID=A0A445DQB4_ARAHY|nr:hypothetical protein Ahy_A03g011291 [Arachis hypogaea]